MGTVPWGSVNNWDLSNERPQKYYCTQRKDGQILARGNFCSRMAKLEVVTSWWASLSNGSHRIVQETTGNAQTVCVIVEMWLPIVHTLQSVGETASLVWWMSVLAGLACANPFLQRKCWMQEDVWVSWKSKEVLLGEWQEVQDIPLRSGMDMTDCNSPAHKIRQPCKQPG